MARCKGKKIGRNLVIIYIKLSLEGNLRLREIRANVEKQFANRRQVLRSPHLRFWSRNVYEWRL